MLYTYVCSSPEAPVPYPTALCGSPSSWTALEASLVSSYVPARTKFVIAAGFSGRLTVGRLPTCVHSLQGKRVGHDLRIRAAPFPTLRRDGPSSSYPDVGSGGIFISLQNPCEVVL